MADNEEIAVSQAILLVAICNSNMDEEIKVKPFELKTDGFDTMILFLGNTVWDVRVNGIPKADIVQDRAINIGNYYGIPSNFIKALFRVPI
jgi:hypothetical protein